MSTPTDIFMVMEYVAGGELFDYIVKHGKVCIKLCICLRDNISSVYVIHFLNWKRLYIYMFE